MKTDGKNLLLNTEMNFPESADKDRHLMRYTLLQEKNHHMAFLSQFWPLSDHSVLFREIRRKVRSRGICVSAMAKKVISHISYFNIFSNFLYKCYSISIIIIDFA